MSLKNRLYASYEFLLCEHLIGDYIHTKVLATDSGNVTAVNENAATIAPVAPKDSNILRNNDNNKNQFLLSMYVKYL